MLYLRAIIYQFFLFITVVPFAVVCVLCAPLPLTWRYKITTAWPRLAVWGAKVILGIRWQLIGAENLPKGSAVILSKHQSAWETMFLISHLPNDMCFVYKRELHRIPFFGWGLALLNMIPIDRAKSRDAFEQVVQVGQKRLDEGRWPILFPEGTRVAQEKLYATSKAVQHLLHAAKYQLFLLHTMRVNVGLVMPLLKHLVLLQSLLGR